MSARCKSCGAQVVWAVTSTGRRMPVDAESAAMGNVLLLAQELGPPVAVVWGRWRVAVCRISQAARMARRIVAVRSMGLDERGFVV